MLLIYAWWIGYFKEETHAEASAKLWDLIKRILTLNYLCGYCKREQSSIPTSEPADPKAKGGVSYNKETAKPPAASADKKTYKNSDDEMADWLCKYRVGHRAF